MAISRLNLLGTERIGKTSIDEVWQYITENGIKVRCYYCGSDLKLENFRLYCPNCFKPIVLFEED